MQMINSVIIEPDKAVSKKVEQQINQTCPSLDIKATASSIEQAYSVIDSFKPYIIFSEINIEGKTVFDICKKAHTYNFEIILFADNTEAAPEAIKFQVCGYLLKPINGSELITSVETAILKIKSSKNLPANSIPLPHHKIIGIPTIEGYNFLNAAEIIRCEGQQRCTRVVTTLQTNIISSYPIGKFRELLKGYGFFTCHKSHLINLAFVRKYTHEGFIYLKDQSVVPLARRRKSQFLDLLKLL
jgi:two-component system LytT family response regulator